MPFLSSESTDSIDTLQQELDLNIQGIERFYNVKSQKKLISIIIDKKQSEKLFNKKEVMISSIFSPSVQTEQVKQQEKIRLFAKKYTFEKLVEKFPKPKAGTNELLLKILQKKMETEVILSHQTRKQIWLLASGAKFNMINNKGLFEGLLNYQNYPKYFQRAIKNDLHRTVNRNTSTSVDDDIQKLREVLTAFSRRNPNIGYCQGLNFIAYFLIVMGYTSEEAFFLLSTMLESIIPMDYYTNMIGVVCDQQIFINILKGMKPHIANKFDQVGLDPSVLSIEWFVCLFTSSLPFYLVKIVWDRLLVEGTRAFIKAGLILIDYFEAQIMKTKEFHEIIMVLEKGSKSLQIPEAEFNAKFQKYYINRKGLKIARDLYREYHLKQKLSEKVTHNKRKPQEQQCDPKWPICTHNLDRSKRQRKQIDVWIYRQQNPPKIIHDYLLNKPKSFEKNFIQGSIVVNTSQKDKKSSNQAFQKPINKTKAPFSEEIIQVGLDSDSLKMTKTNSNLVGKPTQSTNRPTSDLIMGRMEHICSKVYQPAPKHLHKSKKNDIKFLSMILQENEASNTVENDLKRSETFRKIKLASEINEYKEVGSYKSEEEEQTPTLEQSKNSRDILARSRTINFYNEFVENNQELSFIMGNNNIENTDGRQTVEVNGAVIEEEDEEQKNAKEEIKPQSKVSQTFK